MPVLEHIEPSRSSQVDYRIPDLIEAYAKYSPDAVAMTASCRHSLTYHQLHAQLTKIQAHLTALGICR